jgi:hypothetical protein
MPDKPNLAEQDKGIDSAIIGLLIYDESQRPWSIEEVGREIGDDTPDGLARLYGAGLVHRAGGFVWPTRAAVAMHGFDA